MIFRHALFPFDGLIALALLIAVIAVVVVLVVAAMQRRGGGAGPIDEADAILRTRLARGEISVEDYDKARQALGLK
ncbi:MAG: SHOCT domain-containing protein [Candidatus Limnocylindrales bacterium]